MKTQILSVKENDLEKCHQFFTKVCKHKTKCPLNIFNIDNIDIVLDFESTGVMNIIILEIREPGDVLNQFYTF